MSAIHIKSKYIDEGAELLFARYGDGSDGQPLATATVCLAEYNLKPRPDHVYIKTWSENEELYESLLAAGVIGEAIIEITVNDYHSVALECLLLVEAEA